MTIHTFMIELEFDHDEVVVVDSGAITKTLSDLVHHLNTRGVFACLCEPPTTVKIASVKALTSAQRGSVQLSLLDF